MLERDIHDKRENIISLNIGHGSLTRGDHMCHERRALIHPPSEPCPKWGPRCPAPSWPRSPRLTPTKLVRPQNLLQSPNPCSLLTSKAVSHQKGLKEEKDCSKDWLNLSVRMWVAQSHRTDANVGPPAAGRSAGSLLTPCSSLSCSDSTACHHQSRS